MAFRSNIIREATIVPSGRSRSGGSSAATTLPAATTIWSTTMAKIPSIVWLNEPEEHDYPAAHSYLRLIYDDKAANIYVEQLKGAEVVVFYAKDIFRASGLSLLGVSNSHVNRDRKKIKAGAELSPILLVRASAIGKVVIADGYHRLCAVYSYDEDALIPCKIV